MNDRDFDVVVIGAGLGGLQTAYILASEGMRVCVLEKNQQLGGCLQVFSRDKAVLDTGVHYIGGLCPGQNLHRYLSWFGIMNELKLHRMDMDGFDRVSFGDSGEEFPHAQGYGNFIARLIDRFPHERSGIQHYADELRRMCAKFPLYNLDHSDAKDWNDSELSLNARDHIAGMITDPMLRDVLAGNCELYAGDGRSSPFYVHALVTNTYIESAWRCVDGGSQIAKLLARNTRRQGALILNRKEVVGLDIGGEGVRAVRTADGDVFTCRYVIANIHPVPLLDMIGPGHLRPAYRSRVATLANTTSSFTVHLVMEPHAFPYLNHNHYHVRHGSAWDTLRYDPEAFPDSYMLCTPRSTRGGDAYAEAVTIMCYMHFEETERWAGTHNSIVRPGDRGPDYAAFKRKKEEAVISAVEVKFPGIRDGIRSVHSSSPLSFRDFTGTHQGSMYGVAKDAADPLRSFISPRTRIPNLFLTGQNMNMHGILGVTVGSVVTASELVGKRHLLDRIRAAG